MTYNADRLKLCRKRGFDACDMFDHHCLIRLENYFTLNKLNVGLSDPDEEIRQTIKMFLKRIKILGDDYKPCIEHLYLYMNRNNK